MKKIYIKESQLSLINNVKDEEVTFYEFFVNLKNFLKDLMKKPYETNISDLFSKKGLTKDELISKMKDINLIISDENINELPRGDKGKKIAVHTIKYSIPKNRFKDKLKTLYKEIFIESKNSISSCSNIMGVIGNNSTDNITNEINKKKDFYKSQVFSNTSKMIEDMLDMDSDNAYKNRGGFDKTLVSEDGEGGIGGATSCGSVMQGGGSNPFAGQYDAPFKNVQKRDFWKPALTRNKDEKNKSISMNRKS